MGFAFVAGSNCLAVYAAELSNAISGETQQEAIDLVENFVLEAYDELLFLDKTMHFIA